MKKLMLALVASALIVPSVSAQVRVKGYVNKNGTYVAPYYRSSPNNTTFDNYSTRGNVNPYTGKVGTKDPYSNSSSGYGSTLSKPKTSTSCTYLCSSNDGDDDGN
ncbi:MAG TPA: hypothetical protein VKC17_05890 [Sphingomicrobium sp.]|nr:hypothetical protein [Sphingomicrobium sp.]